MNVALRKAFNLYANVRPAKSFEGVRTPFPNVDVVVIRENTQGLYSGVEHYVDEDRSAAESAAIITRRASDRIARYAFEYARANGRREVCLVHKANILKLSQGLFLDRGRAISREYPDIKFRDLIVDNTCMQLVRTPEKFDIIVTTNMFGDIISDLTSGLVGGLGLTAGSNIGEHAALFEAVHGTAPDIAGKGVANPTAVLLAGVETLRYLGQGDMERVINAVRNALKDPPTHTRSRRCGHDRAVHRRGDPPARLKNPGNGKRPCQQRKCRDVSCFQISLSFSGAGGWPCADPRTTLTMDAHSPPLC